MHSTIQHQPYPHQTHEIPRISCGDLEAIVAVLPDPTYVEVRVVGNVDHSYLSSQVSGILPGIQLGIPNGITYSVPTPTNAALLRIYQHSIHSKPKVVGRPSSEGRNLVFRKATWDISEEIVHPIIGVARVKIELTPHALTFEYGKPAPDCIQDVLSVLSSRDLLVLHQLVVKAPYKE